MNIWSIIVHTNTFNFIIFAILIVIILKMIDAPKLISGLRDGIVKAYEDSETLKKEARKNLNSAKEKTKNLDNEVKELFKQTEKTAQDISETIVEQAKAQIKIIEDNTKKILANDEKITKKNLSNITTKASLKLAGKNLKDNLAENPALHQVFIDEAIEELETLDI